MLSIEEVRHIAKLARLRLSGDEEKKMQTELESIFKYIDQLQEVDTAQVIPTAQVTGLCNAFRDDEISAKQATPEELLASSPRPIIDRQISVPSAHG